MRLRAAAVDRDAHFEQSNFFLGLESLATLHLARGGYRLHCGCENRTEAVTAGREYDPAVRLDDFTYECFVPIKRSHPRLAMHIEKPRGAFDVCNQECDYATRKLWHFAKCTGHTAT